MFIVLSKLFAHVADSTAQAGGWKSSRCCRVRTYRIRALSTPRVWTPVVPSFSFGELYAGARGLAVQV